MLRVDYLADHPEVIRPLTVAFAREWPEYYGEFDPDKLREEFESRLQREALPIAMVVMEKNEVVGTATLGGPSIEGFGELQPWVNGLWVDRRCRRRGIGRALIEAIEELARKQGYEEIFAGTDNAAQAFDAWGWETVDTAKHRGQDVTVMRRRLNRS